MAEKILNIDDFSNAGTKSDIPNIEGNIIGLGIDIVACERVERMLKTHGERFLNRCFNPDEAAYCMSRPDSIQELAVRLAAKEASFKAIGARRGMGIGWRDFEVVMTETVIPVLQLNGKAKARGDEIGVTGLWMSLSHEDLWVAAVVIMTTA